MAYILPCEQRLHFRYVSWRSYFSHDSSHSESVASARRVLIFGRDRRYNRIIFLLKARFAITGGGGGGVVGRGAYKGQFTVFVVPRSVYEKYLRTLEIANYALK